MNSHEISFKDLFIFEMANNHQGDVNHGLAIIKEMIKISQKHSINAAVKLQYRHLDTFIHPSFRNDKENEHISRFLSTELNPGQFLKLVQAIKSEGMLTICTPFDEQSVDLILEHQIDIIKIASCSADDWPLLNKIVRANKPIIASTGGLSINEIDNLYSFLKHRVSKFALLHCVGIYPTPNDTLNMNFISRLKIRYPEITIGYSGHEEPGNTDVIKIAIAKGAEIFERHVGVPSDKYVLNSYSMNPDETDRWIEAALVTKEILGGDKVVTKAEAESMMRLKRGVYAKHKINRSEVLNFNNVFFAMPCMGSQLTSSDFGRIRATYTASKNYEVNDAVFESVEPDKFYKLRKIIHAANGMLNEANIVLNENADIELSHHYGLEKFHQFGVLLIKLINREYCKKIIVMFPGQHHPEQYHIKKEETFHVLSGEIELSLNGIISIATKGDIFTIERGVKHAFWSERGTIIEEVSTTHFRNDSFYTDPIINEQDPMQRKTIIEQF